MPTPRINSENENLTHFLTLTVLDWIDIFTKPTYFQIIIKSLDFCRKNKGLLLYEFVIMTNHLHLIMRAKRGYALSQLVSDFKKYTTIEIYKNLNRDSRRYILDLLANSKDRKIGYGEQLWKRENYPEPMFTQKFLDEKIKYVYYNPVKRGYVSKPEDWLYCSARNRILGLNDIIKVDNYEI